MQYRPLGRTGLDVSILGLGAMRNYAVTVWPRRKKIAFVPQGTATFPQAEQDYFFALVDGKPQGVADFINKNPRPRLMDEACLALCRAT